MRKNWAALARHWAWFGRVGILDLEANTNNLVERFFGRLKYVFLVRNTQCTMQELVDVLLRKVVPSFMQWRAQHQVGRVTSGQQQRVQRWVEELVASGAVEAAAAGSTPGLTRVHGSDVNVMVCLGDLSCMCDYSGKQRIEGLESLCVIVPCTRQQGDKEGDMWIPIKPVPPTFPCNAAASMCVHIMAAGRVVGFTQRLRLEAATHLVASGLIIVDADTGICSCQALADVLKVVHFRPKEGFCTCHDRALHGTCCHLRAAPLLPAFIGAELPAAVHHVDGNGEKVSAAPAGAGGWKEGACVH